MRWVRLLGAAALLAPAAARTAVIGGDLCFPYEGWALASRWRIGGALRSVREGWWRRECPDRDWAPTRPGATLPVSPEGIWLRNGFQWRRARWSTIGLRVEAVAPGTRLYVNGEDAGVLAPGDLPLAPWLRHGANLLALRAPPPAGPPAPGERMDSPRIALTGRTGASGDKMILLLSGWRWRADERAADAVPRRDLSDARVIATRPVVSCARWLPPAPIWFKTVLDVPAYWRGRPLRAFLHDVPAGGEVYVNGVRVPVQPGPAAVVHLAPLLKWDGRDVLCLAYARPPPPDGLEGLVAVHWDPDPPAPRFSAGAPLLYDGGAAADREGTGRALRYASQILALSATPFRLEWTTPDSTAPLPAPADGSATAGSAGRLVAAWSATSFSGAAIAAARLDLEGRWSVGSGRNERVWIVTPPTVGRTHRIAANSRLGAYSREVAALAAERGAGVIPVYDVFRSALRRQRRWPVRADFADDAGRLTRHGSYLMALAILEAFSLP